MLSVPSQYKTHAITVFFLFQLSELYLRLHRNMASMHWLDYAIFVALLVVSLGIGFYHGCTGGRQKTTAEFLLANRNLKVIPTVISLLVSFQSAILVLGEVAEMYTFGITFWPMYVLSVAISMVIVERLFVPWFYPLKMTSVFEVIV